jgi:hypothetical protein
MSALVAPESPRLPLTLRADVEHGSLRLTVLLTFIGVSLITFLISSALLSVDLALVPLIIAVAVGYFVSQAVERVLKQTWHSGRTITLASDSVTLAKHGTPEAAVLSEDPAEVLCWRFVINRRTRIPKGWSMFACALHIDSTWLAFYTFLPPDRANAFPDGADFKTLEPLKKGARGDAARPDLRLAGEQRRLRDAENVRWSLGAELSPDDFTTCVAAIRSYYPQWTAESP